MLPGKKLSSDVRYESIYRGIAILGLYRDTDMHTRVSIH